MTQLLADAGPYTLGLSWFDSTGSLDPAIDAVTIGIVDANGDTVVAAGTATTDNNDGTYTYALANQANPDQLTATWQDASTTASMTQRIEIVGAQLFTVDAARKFGQKADATSSIIPLATAAEYPSSLIQAERTRIVDDLEYWTGRAWIPRYARVEITGTGGSYLKLRDGVCRTSDGAKLNRPGRLNDISRLLTVTVNGSSVNVANVEIDPDNGQLYLATGWSAGSSPYNIVVEYVYGMASTTDGVDRIGLKLLVDRLVPSGYPDRALRWDGPDGSSLSLIQPGGPMNNVSRIPEVNQWVNAHDHRVLIG